MTSTSLVTPALFDRRTAEAAERLMQASEFRTRGYVVLRGLLDPAEVEAHTRTLERLSGRSRASLASVATAIQRWKGLCPAWTRPDGVSQHEDLWDLVFNRRVVDTARAILGAGARYLPHSDLHVGFSAVAWHRDNVDRTCGEGPDWDEEREPYRLARVAIYLQSFAESRFSLGLVPGTHRADALTPARRGIEREIARMAEERRVGATPSVLGDRADWVKAECGDAIVFDPRIIHSGSPISGPKYSIFLAYGVPGRHFHRHAAYYRHVRGRLHYRDLPGALIARLREAGLHAAEPARLAARAGLSRPSLIASWRGRSLR